MNFAELLADLAGRTEPDEAGRFGHTDSGFTEEVFESSEPNRGDVVFDRHSEFTFERPVQRRR